MEGVVLSGAGSGSGGLKIVMVSMGVIREILSNLGFWSRASPGSFILCWVTFLTGVWSSGSGFLGLVINSDLVCFSLPGPGFRGIVLVLFSDPGAGFSGARLGVRPGG